MNQYIGTLVWMTRAARARKDILDTSIWWTRHHPSRAAAFDEELSRAFELIELFPDGAPLAIGLRYKHARVRTLIETGHLLVYRRRGRVVTVLAVLASRATQAQPLTNAVVGPGALRTVFGVAATF